MKQKVNAKYARMFMTGAVLSPSEAVAPRIVWELAG